MPGTPAAKAKLQRSPEYAAHLASLDPRDYDADGRYLHSSVHCPETELQTIVDRDLGSEFHDVPLAVTFRHSGWHHDRCLIYAAMHRTRQPDSRRREYADCGSHSYVLRSIEDPSIYRLAGSACHDRFCLPCANERAHAIALNIIDICNTRRTRFLTLTVKAGEEPLAQLLDKLYSSFQALRRRAFWKARVTGGVAFLELTYSATKKRWHPHFHILIEGLYLPQPQIKAAWFELTKDSTIVDIRPVRDTREAVSYVTKYASKPFNNTFVNRPARLDEAMITLKGRKLVMTFGTWRTITLARKPTDDAWEHVASLDQIIRLAALGDVDSLAIMAALTDRDLEHLYARAPPLPALPAPVRIPNHQLTWFGVWDATGQYRHYIRYGD